MKRYTYNFKAERCASICSRCGSKAVAVCTDKVTGDEFLVCESHSKDKGRCNKTSLHPDFIQTGKKTSKIPHKILAKGVLA